MWRWSPATTPAAFILGLGSAQRPFLRDQRMSIALDKPRAHAFHLALVTVTPRTTCPMRDRSRWPHRQRPATVTSAGGQTLVVEGFHWFMLRHGPRGSHRTRLDLCPESNTNPFSTLTRTKSEQAQA